MNKIEKEALQVSKEITVKFIETQRIMPSNFSEIFPRIYKVVLATIMEGQDIVNQSTLSDGEAE